MRTYLKIETPLDSGDEDQLEITHVEDQSPFSLGKTDLKEEARPQSKKQAKKKPDKTKKVSKTAKDTPVIKAPKEKIVVQKPKKTVKSKQEQKTADINHAAEKKKKAGKKVEKALIHLRPKNLVEQRDLFFANNCKVNPVFEYENP